MQANKEAEEEEARSKAHPKDEVCKAVKTPKGELKIYRIHERLETNRPTISRRY